MAWPSPLMPRDFIAGAALVAGFGLLLRILVSLHPYSGAQTPPKYGDYEAQRHWMEVTLHIPIKDWYKNTTNNDMDYWGLDYPPLTSYQSYVHGMFMNSLEPASVALKTSRGYESPSSKLLMRWTVLSSDMLVFFPAAFLFVAAYYNQRRIEEKTLAFAVVLLQPALILIDHGHFQYNCISLGLAVGAAAAVISDRELLACVLYSLSLNHKQMSMYYAPAFFGHLMGRCLRRRNFMLRIAMLGIMVISTFILCWWPFLYSKDAVLEVFLRLIPIQRGIYEDYVSNFWCASGVIIKWKNVLLPHVLARLSFMLTLLAIFPSMLQQILSPSKKGFLLSMLNSSLSFYLFSYQVHEKSILLPIIPATLLALEEPLIWRWLIPCGLLSMFPLLFRDLLLVPYFSLCLLFLLLVYVHPTGNQHGKSVILSPLTNVAMYLSPFGAVFLNVAYILVRPPHKYPYLFEALISSYVFPHIVSIMIYANYKQWKIPFEGSHTYRTKKLN